MLLAIDGRNRHLSVGLWEDGSWNAIVRAGVSSERSADEYCFFLEAAWERARRKGAGSEPEAAWISSVVPSLTPKLGEAVRKAWGLEATVVGPGVKTGIKIRTDFPSEVGSDLVCAAVAARALVGSPCLVVNFGTVLSISAVDSAGDFVGASFAPGIAAAAEALSGVAAQIPEVRLQRPERAIGRSTAQSVQSGLLLGYGGLLGRLLGLMAGELGAGDTKVSVVGTGAEEGRPLLLAEVPAAAFAPDLVLDGLVRIASRAGL